MTQPPDIISLTSLDSFNVTGRGIAYVVHNPETYSKRDSGGLLGKTILLDGKLVKVIGIESFAIEIIRKGTPIGLLVEPIKPYVPRRHFADLLHAAMTTNPDIWCLSGDLGYGMLREIERDYPDRFVNVGAAEQLLVGAGVGLALEGKLPFVYSITPFLTHRPAEWLRNYLDHESINVKLIGAGNQDDYAHDGFSHHIFNVETYMATYPNINLYLPDRAPEELSAQFAALVADPKPGLMVLRK